MMSCQEAAKLISEERDRSLRFGEKMSLKMHLVFCALCRGYKKNLHLLSRIAARAGEVVASKLSFGNELVLSSASKQRIKDKLDKANPPE
jgi:hypothetical protein